MIAVVGGCYAEVCAIPHWDHVYGSAGRAAAAISSTQTPVELHTLLSKDFENDFLLTMAAAGDITLRSSPQQCSVTFEYLHPLASPSRFEEGNRPETGAFPHVRSKNILYFGMVEYIPTVHGERVVYDPQGGEPKPKRFRESGSTARELIYVLNEGELRTMTGVYDIDVAAKQLRDEEQAVAIVVKRGPLGASVHTNNEHKLIPCYRARRVFKIGSGDIFAAAFSYFWMESCESLENAADLASRVVACYVETQDPFIPTKDELLRDYDQPVFGQPGRIYLAAPFFSLEQRWLLEETISILEHFGCSVFSPFHAVGMGGSTERIANEDLKGLKSCNTVLALINDGDLGTVFEIGYGKAVEKTIVIYAERNSPRDLTMMEGTRCSVFPDYCSALYSAVWDSFTP